MCGVVTNWKRLSVVVHARIYCMHGRNNCSGCVWLQNTVSGDKAKKIENKKESKRKEKKRKKGEKRMGVERKQKKKTEIVRLIGRRGSRLVGKYLWWLVGSCATICETALTRKKGENLVLGAGKSVGAHPLRGTPWCYRTLCSSLVWPVLPSQNPALHHRRLEQGLP